ncbi:MAG: hypothetical protein K6F05_04690, partial [Succinivibrio sp.]|nr:hypothetical protein [Succinivibrio sp.]
MTVHKKLGEIRQALTQQHPLLLTVGETLLFLSLCRIGLMLWQNESYKLSDVGFILLQGLRVDVLLCCAFFALPLLYWMLSYVF